MERIVRSANDDAKREGRPLPYPGVVNPVITGVDLARGPDRSVSMVALHQPEEQAKNEQVKAQLAGLAQHDYLGVLGLLVAQLGIDLHHGTMRGIDLGANTRRDIGAYVPQVHSYDYGNGTRVVVRKATRKTAKGETTDWPVPQMDACSLRQYGPSDMTRLYQAVADLEAFESHGPELDRPPLVSRRAVLALIHDLLPNPLPNPVRVDLQDLAQPRPLPEGGSATGAPSGDFRNAGTATAGPLNIHFEGTFEGETPHLREARAAWAKQMDELREAAGTTTTAEQHEFASGVPQTFEEASARIAVLEHALWLATMQRGTSLNGGRCVLNLERPTGGNYGLTTIHRHVSERSMELIAHPLETKD